MKAYSFTDWHYAKFIIKHAGTPCQVNSSRVEATDELIRQGMFSDEFIAWAKEVISYFADYIKVARMYHRHFFSHWCDSIAWIWRELRSIRGQASERMRSLLRRALFQVRKAVGTKYKPRRYFATTEDAHNQEMKYHRSMQRSVTSGVVRSNARSRTIRKCIMLGSLFIHGIPTI